jgi:hypothetical protein
MKSAEKTAKNGRISRMTLYVTILLALVAAVFSYGQLAGKVGELCLRVAAIERTLTADGRP